MLPPQHTQSVPSMLSFPFQLQLTASLMFKLNCKLSVTAGTDVAVMFQCSACCIMHARPDASVSAENISATTNGGTMV